MGEFTMKKAKLFIVTMAISIIASFPAVADWKHEPDGRWWYENEDGSYPANQWQEIDGKEYYFGADGYMLRNTFAPDDREVGPDGSWTGFISSYAEREQAFLNTYKQYLDSLVFLGKSCNHIGVMTEMESETYKELLLAIPKDEYCYPGPDGMGLKIQKNHLYYGNLTGGMAKGNGIAYNSLGKKNDTSVRYGYYSGMWDNNAPNGYGTEFFYMNGSNGTTSYTSGNYVNWYQDGEMLTVNNRNNRIRTYHYTVVDKFPVGIGTKNNKYGSCTVVAYPEEKISGYLTFYDTAQTAAHVDINDGIKKNAYGYWSN